MRPISIQTQFNRYAEGSALIQVGFTHVLCCISIVPGVPDWLKGKGKGWLTSEYSMLPRATHTRSQRERTKVSGRTQEIQRLVGRALRSAIDLDALGENTVMIDCDVLQADGGTRTSAITGSFVALAFALAKMKEEGKIKAIPLLNTVSAVSVGIKDNQVLVDLDYEEDSSCDVDSNFVLLGADRFVEIQGTGEKNSFTLSQFQDMANAALIAGQKIRSEQFKSLEVIRAQLPKSIGGF